MGVLSAAVLPSVAACRRGVPVVDPGPAPPTSDGTISGRLMTPGDASRLAGRRVEVVNVATGSRRSVSSGADGGFTVKVPPGKYRLQIELRPGEAIVKAPETIDINASVLDGDIVIEIAPGPARPHPADSTRGTEGLGAPIA
ncbi:MAG: carboxypeptidase regulatory-like domain-containing protein [Acidobacteria bacterium]|nr:carboxypeptidase regulatory-like domain-containing protein [Acidobacteriota bacterium]